MPPPPTPTPAQKSFWHNPVEIWSPGLVSLRAVAGLAARTSTAIPASRMRDILGVGLAPSAGSDAILGTLAAVHEVPGISLLLTKAWHVTVIRHYSRHTIFSCREPHLHQIFF